MARMAKEGSPQALANMVTVYAFAGEIDRAFSQLDDMDAHALSGSSYSFWWHELQELRVSRFLEPLHTDPRWAAWVKEMDRRRDAKFNKAFTEKLHQYAENQHS
ncbi:MAG: hypothetical protein PVG42_14390 [Lysobacterales bacterium]